MAEHFQWKEVLSNGLLMHRVNIIYLVFVSSSGNSIFSSVSMPSGDDDERGHLHIKRIPYYTHTGRQPLSPWEHTRSTMRKNKFVLKIEVEPDDSHAMCDRTSGEKTIVGHGTMRIFVFILQQNFRMHHTRRMCTIETICNLGNVVGLGNGNPPLSTSNNDRKLYFSRTSVTSRTTLSFVNATSAFRKSSQLY